ncbi:MAG: glycosyltransferase family 4 protein [bacterium]
MKILYLITQSDFGGAQRYVFDLANNLKVNHQITIAAGPSASQELFSRLDKINVNYTKLKYLRRAINPFWDLLALLEIIRLIKKIRPEVIHLNSSKAGALGALAAKLLGVKKIVYTVHGFVFLEPMSIIKKQLYIFIEKFSARYKDYLITVSEADRQAGLDYRIAKSEKMITIHNGLDFSQLNFLPADEAKKELLKKKYDHQSLVIGTSANYYATKGLTYLVQAAPEIIKEIPEAIFILLGDGPERKKLEQLIGKNKLEKYFILGYREKAVRYLKAFDLFTLPSVKEGLPYAILEAMAAGLPIVASAVGGIPEMIQASQNGLLVKAKNPELLSKTIIGLLKNGPLSQKLGQQALTDVHDNFDLEVMVKKTEKLYL